MFKNACLIIVAVSLVLLIAFSAQNPPTCTTGSAELDLQTFLPDETSPQSILANLNMPFLATREQATGQVTFIAHTFGGQVFVTETGDIVYNLPYRDQYDFIPGSVVDFTPH